MHLRGGVHNTRVLGGAVARMQDDRISSTTERPATGGAPAGMPALDPALDYGMGWWIDRVNEGVFADQRLRAFRSTYRETTRHFCARIGRGHRAQSGRRRRSSTRVDAAQK
jgi:hypothetical protein